MGSRVDSDMLPSEARCSALERACQGGCHPAPHCEGLAAAGCPVPCGTVGLGSPASEPAPATPTARSSVLQAALPSPPWARIRSAPHLRERV